MTFGAGPYDYIGIKYLTARRLIELLSQLDPDSQLVPNAVNNLAIYKDEVYTGFIDFIGEGEIL
jgi:hypothetical protein